MIVTIEDQVTLIRSHLGSVERQKNKGDYAALATFFQGISQAALTASEYCVEKAKLAEEEARHQGEKR